MSENSSLACPAEISNFCAQRHWSIYWVLIVCSLAMITGRVMTVGSGDDSPFFSANDRSRWCTIRSLGDDGTYEIDEVIADPVYNWDTIDKVKHVGADGDVHSYSSKPTLLPTLMAGKYTAIRSLSGWNLTGNTVPVVRILLVLGNVLPWAVFLWCLASVVDKILVRDWTRYFVVAAAGFGTYLSSFAVSLNNHLPAAVGVMVAVYCIAEIYRNVLVGEKVLRWRDFFLAGLFSAFAASCDLPALSFLACAAVLCLMKSPMKTLFAFVPAALVVAAGMFGTNYLAHGDWKPAYAHRSDGPVIAGIEAGDPESFATILNNGTLPDELAAAIQKEIEILSPIIEPGAWPTIPDNVERWVVRDRSSTNQVAITRGTGTNDFEIHEWKNRYDFPGSYWTSDKKSNVDLGQQSLSLYAFHCLFGHHGIFSLTPLWILSFAGMFALLFNERMNLRWFGLMTIGLTAIVLFYYIAWQPPMNRNYGGWSSALRWLFWLAPLWLVSMLPIVDWLGRTRRGRASCFLLLGISAVSALYAANNPWVQPWLYEIWDLTGLPE